MNYLFLTVIIILQLTGLVYCLIFIKKFTNFLNSVNMLKNDLDMKEFKKLVKENMYAALANIVFLGGSWILYFIGFFIKILNIIDFGFILIPAVLIVIFSLKLKTLEKKLQNLPTENPALEDERDRVVDIWLHKPFPNW